MNLVILDGRINSSIERVADARRDRARFVVATTGGARVGVEVRGSGASRLRREWSCGDSVHVRGHITAGGFVSADIIRRKNPTEADGPQLALELPGIRGTAMSAA